MPSNYVHFTKARTCQTIFSLLALSAIRSRRWRKLCLPNDANPLGALLGGRLMHWIDLAGAMAAHRHSRNYVVTASVDHIDFLVPVRVGDLVILRSSVNRVFHTSMEVGVKVYVENYIADTAQHVSSAYLTFVAVDGPALI